MHGSIKRYKSRLFVTFDLLSNISPCFLHSQYTLDMITWLIVEMKLILINKRLGFRDRPLFIAGGGGGRTILVASRYKLLDFPIRLYNSFMVPLFDRLDDVPNFLFLNMFAIQT